MQALLPHPCVVQAWVKRKVCRAKCVSGETVYALFNLRSGIEFTFPYFVYFL